MERRSSVLNRINEVSEELASTAYTLHAEARGRERAIFAWSAEGSELQKIAKIPVLVATTFPLMLGAGILRLYGDMGRWMANKTAK